MLALLGAEPLALAPSAVRSLSAPAAMYGWGEDEEDPGYELVGDLAVITVRGMLMQRGCWWWHGYDTLAAAFGQALLDGRARAVILAIDSPGGCRGVERTMIIDAVGPAETVSLLDLHQTNEIVNMAHGT